MKSKYIGYLYDYYKYIWLCLSYFVLYTQYYKPHIIFLANYVVILGTF